MYGMNESADNSFWIHRNSTMTSAVAVWVKLVIDGDDRSEAIPCTFTSGMKIVHDLKEAIVKQTPELWYRSIGPAFLKVYPPGTNVVPIPEEGAESLPPYLPLSDPGFPKGVAGPTPLIVTATSRQQVSLVFSVLLFNASLIA
jgi:hypothetical protein